MNCAINAYTVGGTVTGLSGSGLVLQINAGNDLTVMNNGAFAFSTPVVSGGAFAVTVKTQPSAPMQTCSVSQGTGTVANGNVTTVAITCVTQTYAVGGTVSGLSGDGLVLQDNLGDNLDRRRQRGVHVRDPRRERRPLRGHHPHQPSSPTQTCAVASGSGTITDAAVSNVVVTCTTNYYIVGGTVIGLAGSGLVLNNNGGGLLAVSTSGAFTFATAQASGTPFAVTIASQPTNPDQTCTLSGATGTVGGATSPR